MLLDALVRLAVCCSLASASAKELLTGCYVCTMMHGHVVLAQAGYKA